MIWYCQSKHISIHESYYYILNFFKKKQERGIKKMITKVKI